MTTSVDHNQNTQKLLEIVKEYSCGMLTTVDEDGSLHSRPMFKSGITNSEPILWFFSHANSHTVFEIEHRQQVNVSFSSSEKQQYVSISGIAELVKDHKKMEELWQPKLQTWFPQGLDEPDLVLLKVNIKKADYWDSDKSNSPQSIELGNKE